MFKIKARRFRKRHSFIQLEFAGNLKTLFDFETLIVKIAFFTNVTDLQAALSACVTVRDWKMLMEAVLIPEEWMAMAYARLTELTVQELEVSSNILLDLFFIS